MALLKSAAIRLLHDVGLLCHASTLENLKNKLWEEFEISYVQAVEYRDREIDLKEAQKEAKHLKARLKAIGEVNLGSIKEYESVNKRYEFFVEQRDDLNTAMSGLKNIINRMDRNIKKNFNNSFSRTTDRKSVV